ncbi:unnamed protein product, partial [Rotaria sp. Silwood1]
MSNSCSALKTVSSNLFKSVELQKNIFSKLDHRSVTLRGQAEQHCILANESASKIQAAFRHHQAQLKLKNQVAWQIHEKLEYSSEQTEAKLKDMFEKLLKSSDLLSPSVAKLLQKAGLPV